MESALTTQRERDELRRLLEWWIEEHLPRAPRDQVRSIELALLHWRPSYSGGRGEAMD